MARTTSVLAVANLTALSDELHDALRERARSGPLSVTLLVPASGTKRVGAREQLDRAVERMRKAGIEAEGQLGPGDPYAAVHEIWDPARYDELIICTLPLHASRWLNIGLPGRLRQLTGARVTHIEVPAEEPSPHHPGHGHVPEHEHHGLLEPLGVLGWGGRKPKVP